MVKAKFATDNMGCYPRTTRRSMGSAYGGKLVWEKRSFRKPQQEGRVKAKGEVLVLQMDGGW